MADEYVNMADRLRPLACHLFIAAILSALWLYAELRRQIGEVQLQPDLGGPAFVQRQGEAPREGGREQAEPTTRPAFSDLGLLGGLPE